jgi:hypothetical protein
LAAPIDHRRTVGVAAADDKHAGDQNRRKSQWWSPVNSATALATSAWQTGQPSWRSDFGAGVNGREEVEGDVTFAHLDHLLSLIRKDTFSAN